MKQIALIGIGGGSCSGKTTLAKELAHRLGSNILPVDSYYRDLSHLSAAERAQWNFDHPDALEWPLLVDHLSLLAAGHSVPCPRYDFATHTRRTECRPIEPTPVVIVEGILALHAEIPTSAYRLQIFVDAAEELRLRRRILRDVAERGRTRESIQQQFDTTVQPMHLRFVEPTLQRADIVVDGRRPIGTLVEEILGAGIDLTIKA